MKIYYKFLQKIHGYPLRKLEPRKYLTFSGFKNYTELTLKDKLDLNIEI
jgi:hypothetical protein